MESRALRPLAVVEDSDEDYEALVRVLRDTTSREAVVRYRTGEEALAGLPAVRPLLVLLDLNLPGVQGLEVLATLKADAVLRPVPVVVLSGSDRQEEIDAAYAAGANAYVNKPLDFAQLRRAIVSLHEFWQIASLPGQP